jgi:hypothetical protein
VFPIFPSPQGCADHGAKVTFNETLEAISTQMGMGRPMTGWLVDIKRPPYGLVLKREFSDSGRDVFIPNLSGGSEEEEVRRAAAFVRKRMGENRNDESLWMTQEYAHFLLTGEVRFMCVGGVPIRETVSGRHPDDHPEEAGEMWSYESNQSLKTLSALQ